MMGGRAGLQYSYLSILRKLLDEKMEILIECHWLYQYCDETKGFT